MGFFNFNTTIFGQQFLPATKRTVNHIAWIKTLLDSVQFAHTKIFTYFRSGFEGDFILNYSSTKTYYIGELVYYNDVVYSCILTSTGNLPTDATYYSVKSFSFQDVVRSADKSVYYCIADNPNGIAPINPDYWVKLQENFIGVDERMKASAQVLKFEYILNKWFGTDFNYPSSTNDVYITNTPSDVNSFVYGFDESESSAHTVNDFSQTKYINASYSASSTSYDINIPTAVYDTLNPSEPTGTTIIKDAIVRSFADKHNLAGLTYKIVLY